MNIAITPKKTEGLERLLEVSVPIEEVREREDRAAKRYASQVRLPGFRPGKAPAAMVRKKFAVAIRQEAIESAVQDAFKEVLEREKVELATQPHVHELKFIDGQPSPSSCTSKSVRPSSCHAPWASASPARRALSP